MSSDWPTTVLFSTEEVFEVLADLRGKRWLSRGQSCRYGGLVPSIDRDGRKTLTRLDKLMLERKSIDLFRSIARFFAGQGEQGALTSDVFALMVLRHYGVPTRLLDWSRSPYVAAFFAAQRNETKDGEIWTFDEPRYEQEGEKQWIRWPETTTHDNAHQFVPDLTAFRLEEPPDWFVCQFYPADLSFPRQDAQAGAYSMTARFGRDHADKIAELLTNDSQYHLYVLRAGLKLEVRRILREDHGVWLGSLYPDSAGAAMIAGSVFLSEA